MKKAKNLSSKDKDKHLQATKKALAAGKVVTINPDAIIQIPVIGSFRDYISEMLNYLFTLEEEDKVIQILAHIRNGFKDVPKDTPYDPYMNAIWTCMTLMTEINHQAAEQGHTIITDQSVDESVSNLINSFDAGTEKNTSAIYKDAKINYENTRKAAEKAWNKEEEEERKAKVLAEEVIKTEKKPTKAKPKDSNEG